MINVYKSWIIVLINNNSNNIQCCFTPDTARLISFNLHNTYEGVTLSLLTRRGNSPEK